MGIFSTFREILNHPSIWEMREEEKVLEKGRWSNIGAMSV
jgi:hypothetical protein